MKKYIDLNTECRMNKNKFEKKYRRMNNSVFFEMIENVGKYRNLKLVTKWNEAKYYISQPNFHSGHIFGFIKWIKKTTFNKSTYLGYFLDIRILFRFHIFRILFLIVYYRYFQN